jgi:5'-methylthioadenosine phosphorylase
LFTWKNKFHEISVIQTENGGKQQMDKTPILAVIGGSGLYNMVGLKNTQEIDLLTPFGKPSAPIILGELAGQAVAFLTRHGIGHHLSPGEVNYRANIYALKAIGVERIVSVSACGSLRSDYAPGDIVIPDQIMDLTRDRERSFFGKGLVVHVGVADPFCPDLSHQLHQAVISNTARVHLGGALIVIEGPRFSTKSESNTYRSWGMSIIGMTACPEAFLAREAELCYTTMAHVTDYDVWHQSEEPVSVEAVISVLNRNTQLAQQVISNLVQNLHIQRQCACSQALASAIITNPTRIPAETRNNLDLLIGKYLK